MTQIMLFQIIGAVFALFLLYASFEFGKLKYIERYDKENAKQSPYHSTYINPSTNMLQVQEDVLNMYEKSNIRIPSDIIEDLIHMNITDENEIFAYIENQRNYWKLENSKKPYKVK